MPATGKRGGRSAAADRRGRNTAATTDRRARSADHRTFVIERRLAGPPATVFKAFKDPKAKARWFVGPDGWKSSDHALEFKVGGRESVSGGPPGGPVHAYRAIYQDIVPNERIIYTYDMHLDRTRISVSLATFELSPAGPNTLLKYTEQGAYLDGFDTPAKREHGTRELLGNLSFGLLRDREPDVVVTRELAAPRRLVWAAWTSPEHIRHWWGPERYTAPSARVDLRVGGTALLCMRSPDGRERWTSSEFREIVPEKRLVSIDRASDANGTPLSPASFGMPDWPDDTLLTVTFADAGKGRTKLTLEHTGLPPGDMARGAEMGWRGALDKFIKHVATLT